MVNKPKQLLVEDEDTRGVIIHLMKQHIFWGNNETQWPVFIDPKRSKNEVLDKKKPYG